MIDSLRMVLIYAVEFLDIIPDSAKADPDIAAIAQLVAEYEALAPKPDEWPDRVQWYAICADGEGYWYVEEPRASIGRNKWISAWPHSYGGTVVMPLGIDWRLLKWQRPEVTP